MERTSYFQLSAQEIAKTYLRRTKILIAIFILIIIALFFAAITFLDSHSWMRWLYFLALGLMFVFYLLFKILHARDFFRITGILTQDCDPVKYLEVMNLLQARDWSKKQSSHATYCLYKASGFYYLDDMESMRRCLEQARFEKQILTRNILLANLWGNYGIKTKQQDIYEASLRQLQAMKDTKISLQNLDKIAYIIHIWRLNEALGAEDADKAKELFAKIHNPKKSNNNRVVEHFQQYRLAKLCGQQQEAKEALEFVVSYGNTMAIKTQAEALLKEMEEE